MGTLKGTHMGLGALVKMVALTLEALAKVGVECSI
jgi:hypothetical protein